MILESAAPAGPLPVTKAEKKRLATVLHATEYLFLENVALKLVLEYRAVPNWQKLLDHFLSDKEILAGVRLKFRDLHSEIERSTDPSHALEGSGGILRRTSSGEKDSLAFRGSRVFLIPRR
jgi:hypothetical protein